MAALGGKRAGGLKGSTPSPYPERGELPDKGRGSGADG